MSSAYDTYAATSIIHSLSAFCREINDPGELFVIYVKQGCGRHYFLRAFQGQSSMYSNRKTGIGGSFYSSKSKFLGFFAKGITKLIKFVALS